MAGSLGLESGVVRIVEYDARWPALFAAERQLIRDRCGTLELSLEHVGGTSIPGMCAKPVLDIAAGRGAVLLRAANGRGSRTGASMSAGVTGTAFWAAATTGMDAINAAWPRMGPPADPERRRCVTRREQIGSIMRGGAMVLPLHVRAVADGLAC